MTERARRVMALIAHARQAQAIDYRTQMELEQYLDGAGRSPAAAEALTALAYYYRDIGDQVLSRQAFVRAAEAGARVEQELAAMVTGERAALPDLPPLDGFGAPPTPQGVASLSVLVPVVLGTPVPSGTPSWQPGALIAGRYRVLEELGRGGMATVLGVKDQELDEVCALKLFHAAGHDNEVARFKREVSLSRRIVHENVIKLFDIGTDEGRYFLTMEILRGADLAHRLRNDNMSVKHALGLVAQACRGLAAAHAKGVVHRDIKPANLFVQQDGVLKVTDFGIARPVDATSLTQEGMFIGTPQFTSPEQARGSEAGPAADLYAIGVVLYLVCTNALPFVAKDAASLMYQHVHEPPVSPRSRQPKLPRRLDALILATLEKDPARRPASASVVADELQAIIASASG